MSSVSVLQGTSNDTSCSELQVAANAMAPPPSAASTALSGVTCVGGVSPGDCVSNISYLYSISFGRQISPVT